MKHRLYVLYWIKTSSMTEPFKEGYIGITKNSLATRLSQHRCSTRPIGYQVRANEVTIVELHRGMKEDILELEYKYRPNMDIGWNIMAGGNYGTVRCPKCNCYMEKGSRNILGLCSTCNDYKGHFAKDNIPHNYGKGEKYILTSPEGLIYEPEVFTKFCNENNLTPQNLRKVAKGSRKHHKGWKATKVY